MAKTTTKKVAPKKAVAKKIPAKVPAKALNAALAKRAAKTAMVAFNEVRKLVREPEAVAGKTGKASPKAPEPKTKAGKAVKRPALPPSSTAVPPAPVLPAESSPAPAPAAPKPPAGKFRNRRKPWACPGGCKGTRKTEGGEWCEVCSPAERVKADREKRGACMHQDVGLCPACLKPSVGEREGGRGNPSGQPLDTYQVFRDYNGIVYLRVAVSTKKRKADLFVVNKAFSVELVSICHDSVQSLYLQPVVGSSVYEAARRLFTPLNDQVTISYGAKEYLTEILNNKELEMKTTKAVAASTVAPKNAAPAKSAKFATTNPLPAATGKAAKKEAAVTPVKETKETKKAAKTAEAAEPKTRGRAGKYFPEQKITLLQKGNPGRDGTKRHEWYELYRTCKTVGAYLAAGGDRGYLVGDAERRNLISIK